MCDIRPRVPKSLMNIVDSEDKISQLIEADDWTMKVLNAASTLNLPDWWIGAGFLRNKIWNFMEGKSPELSRDVDLVYFDSKNKTEEADWNYDAKMSLLYPFAEWEVRNQARMHYVNNFEPFMSTSDGIAHWVETATCIGVRLTGKRLEYLFCYGTADLFGLVARPTPYFSADKELLKKFFYRIDEKNWKNKWPHLRIETH